MKIVNNTKYKNYSPVIIGGVGGSGTRLIAQCLIEAGFNMGSDLNISLDNTWFTLLFKRYEILSSSDEEFDSLMEMFLIGMIDNQNFTENQIKTFRALAANDRRLHNASWLNEKAINVMKDNPKIMPGDNWGWKEPNSHMILDRLIEKFDNLKYIHVMRNGLDMAYSPNQFQLLQWGKYFFNENPKITPYNSLRYWCLVHKRIIKIGEELGDKFLLLNYDEFCLKPKKQVDSLIDFLNIDNKENVKNMLQLIKPPKSIGRFKNFDLNAFNANDVDYVSELGFNVD